MMISIQKRVSIGELLKQGINEIREVVL